LAFVQTSVVWLAQHNKPTKLFNIAGSVPLSGDVHMDKKFCYESRIFPSLSLAKVLVPGAICAPCPMWLVSYHFCMGFHLKRNHRQSSAMHVGELCAVPWILLTSCPLQPQKLTSKLTSVWFSLVFASPPGGQPHHPNAACVTRAGSGECEGECASPPPFKQFLSRTLASFRDFLLLLQHTTSPPIKELAKR
jgi:hypothetical protein